MKRAKTFMIFFNAILIVTAGVFGDSGVLAATWKNDPVVATTHGNVKGFADSFNTWTWKAIPYAKPPVGELRWKAPQDPDPWTETRQEKAFCSMCPQFSTTEAGTGITGNENCLCLNIWRPQSAGTGLPVYFWIHGGSNVQGSADPYISAAMSSRSAMVVVTINYRLGPFGWFTHPALRDGEDSRNSSGNYATMDMIKALEWVRNNIAAFGGDPQNVTIAGQSAGGINVLSLMISPLAGGLFHRVISQSGGLEPASQKDGDEYANSVIETLLVRDGTPEKSAKNARESMSNAEIRTYLRSKTMEEFFTAIKDMQRNPAVFNDGAVIQKEGADAFSDPSKYHQVPVIIGSTSEEGKLFMYMGGVYKFIGNGLYQWMGKRVSQLGRQNGLDRIAQRMSSNETQPGVWCYIFEYGQYRKNGYNAWPADSGPTDKMSWAIALGSFHALDIPFNFGIVGSFPLFENATQNLFREDNRQGQLALSDAMMAYSAQFARTGNPNVAGFPEWTEFPAGKWPRQPKFMLFDANNTDALLKMAPDVEN